MEMRVIAVFSLVGEPAVRPDLGRPENLAPSPQDDAHRFVVEYERKARHAHFVGKQPAIRSFLQNTVLQ